MPDIVDPLIPPYRFGCVQAQVFRGSYPKARNYRFLRRLQLKTIISLIPRDHDNSLPYFCADEGIERIIINVESPNENVTVTDTVVSKCLEIISSPSMAPLYLHCLDGSNVTGVVIMCLRKLQLWRISSYQNEYLRYEQEGELIPEEREFVEAFTGRGLVLPNPYATWIWPGAPVTLETTDTLPFKDGIHPLLRSVKLGSCTLLDNIQSPDPPASLKGIVADSATIATERNNGIDSKGQYFSSHKHPHGHRGDSHTKQIQRDLIYSGYMQKPAESHSLNDSPKAPAQYRPFKRRSNSHDARLQSLSSTTTAEISDSHVTSGLKKQSTSKADVSGINLYKDDVCANSENEYADSRHCNPPRRRQTADDALPPPNTTTNLGSHPECSSMSLTEQQPIRSKSPAEISSKIGGSKNGGIQEMDIAAKAPVKPPATCTLHLTTAMPEFNDTWKHIHSELKRRYFSKSIKECVKKQESSEQGDGCRHISDSLGGSDCANPMERQFSYNISGEGESKPSSSDYQGPSGGPYTEALNSLHNPNPKAAIQTDQQKVLCDTSNNHLLDSSAGISAGFGKSEPVTKKSLGNTHQPIIKSTTSDVEHMSALVPKDIKQEHKHYTIDGDDSKEHLQGDMDNEPAYEEKISYLVDALTLEGLGM